MKQVFQEYGSMMLAMMVSVITVGLLSFGLYQGSKGERTQGLLQAIGKEAAFGEVDTAPVREDIVTEGKRTDVTLSCQTVLKTGQTKKLSDIFKAWEDGKSVPVYLLHIYNERGEDVLHNGEVWQEGNDICFRHAGNYFVNLKIKTKRDVRKSIPLYVKKGEENE